MELPPAIWMRDILHDGLTAESASHHLRFFGIQNDSKSNSNCKRNASRRVDPTHTTHQRASDLAAHGNLRRHNALHGKFIPDGKFDVGFGLSVSLGFFRNPSNLESEKSPEKFRVHRIREIRKFRENLKFPE